MLKSMTGYGRSKVELDGKEYIIEIKSVNHRFIDISVKLPKQLSFIEDKIKKVVLNTISRGKIEINITYSNILSECQIVNINEKVAHEYIEQLKKIARDNGLSENMQVSELLKLPDILINNNKPDEEKIWNAFEKTLNEALDKFNEMREIEGKRLEKDISDRIKVISENLNIISKNSTGLVEKYVVKLESRVNEILENDAIDKNRLAQEAIIFADKCSIEEEITRLESHINQFGTILKEDKAKGKKIDFLLQEMNRETNTIASKANCLDITKMVIEIKTELENIREQIQNIE